MASGDSQFKSLINRIDQRQAVVAVIGLGYVGIPLAHVFINAGYRVLGYDIDQRKIDQLNAGKSYIGHIPSEWVESWLKTDRFCATADIQRLAAADAIIICVPTPLSSSRDPDLTYVVATVRQIATILRPGQLVVLESTTYPGTTRDVMLPELIRAGLEVGRDFFLAYSPEREDPGNRQFSADKIPKVVGGYDELSRRAAEALYRSVAVDVVPVSSCEAAELCKILENTYRAVNIALVNELKMLCERINVDVWEVIDAAKTKPFGFQAFYPGPGLGGHCIPIDPFYLSWVARKHGTSTRFIELAGEVNASMPQYVVRRVTEALNNVRKPVRGSKVCILGVAYKRDVDDPRESPSFVLMEELLKQGAVLSYSDPHIPHLPRMRAHNLPAMDSCELTPEFLANQDCLIIATDHSRFDYPTIVEHAQLVVDTRNATRHVQRGRERIIKA
jgi:UDP-N-acetyl-D-glucosamine dehydrogenase